MTARELLLNGSDARDRTFDAVDQCFEAGQRVGIHPNVFHGVLDLAPASAWQVVQDDGCLRILLVSLQDGFDEAALPRRLRRR